MVTIKFNPVKMDENPSTKAAEVAKITLVPVDVE
jgi:hypothetical protein